ncbi:T9SS type A sorting domain-containing protein [bacterium SCSIO 12741]|nr:T9SS type A sorting domain-containing protein [bacterium SCSIO 12741]
MVSKYFILAWGALLCTFSVQGQTLERTVIGSAGTTQKAGNLEISSTVGETAVVMQTTPTLIITQGFQQPQKLKNDSSSGPDGINEEQLAQLQLYPNPSHEAIHLVGELTGEYQLRVVDARGKLVLDRSVNLTPQEKFTLPVSDWAVGQYHLQLVGKAPEDLYDFRVIKQ